jgi:hypothetical protein
MVSLRTALPPDVRRGLCPAVRVLLIPGLRPFPACETTALDQGQSPKSDEGDWPAGHSPRLTSGGKAVTG